MQTRVIGFQQQVWTWPAQSHMLVFLHFVRRHLLPPGLCIWDMLSQSKQDLAPWKFNSMSRLGEGRRAALLAQKEPYKS